MPRPGGAPENLTPWKPGQTGNPKGRKPLLISTMLKDLEEAGYQRVNKEQITAAFEFLMALDHEKLKEFIEGNNVPILMRLVGQRLLTKDGFEAIQTLLDRAHGKAKQAVEHSGVIETGLAAMSDEELQKRFDEHINKLQKTGLNPGYTDAGGVAATQSSL